ncbi:MAG TPA: succinate--CoA ligase subunit alpha [Streptosporangiaceae bacterium]|jgi:succinyl-CoA synthetase alpha subunit
MAILVSEMSRVLVQGLTGEAGQDFAENMRRSGTNLVAGVRPGRGGTRVGGVPVYDTVAEAVRGTGATASVLAVPASVAVAAAHEAIAADIELVVIYAEGVPVHDALRLRELAANRRCVVIGPNSAGVMSPGVANLSDMRTVPMRPGPVGLVSKSGTLSYEIISDLAAEEIGISTVMCVGGDPVVGTTSADAVSMFLADEATRAVVLIGEPGGGIEVEAVRRWADAGRPIPLVALIVGQALPPGREFGHAGAVAQRPAESALEKMTALAALGAHVVDSLAGVPAAVKEVLRR